MRPEHFSDPATVASYVERTRRAVPGLDVLHRIVEQILAESVPQDGRVLVVGAGGGLELAHLAQRHDGWSFDGVDPSAPMLRLARETMGPLAARAALQEGDVHRAPDGPFDGAVCLLTLHFLTAEQRLGTLREIRRRLRHGAPLLTFHHSVPADGARIARFTRYARFAAGPAAAPADVARSGSNLATQLPAVGPEEDERLLLEAGFDGLELVYAALTLRGWSACA
ncbi:MAG TPA: class I SAM-dependent methyltransferase [Conexibacter sp.]|nr:class I SAM-dependent methyltransferase [Conexibacter sp.]